MIYKDLFKIIINGEVYTEEYKQFFTLEEMKKIYADNLDKIVVATYEPILTEDILSPEEIYGWNDDGDDENE